MEGRRPFHDLSAGETAVPPIGREMRRGQNSPADKSEKRSRLQRESLGTEEKTSRTRDIHSKAFTPGFTPGVLCRFLIGKRGIAFVWF